MSDLPVMRVVAESLFRKLEGFDGYPKRGPGESYFIDAFQLACVSVGHAKAVIDSFDGKFPTLREIRDVAFNLKPKFESPGPSQREQWEKEYGKPELFEDVSLPAKYPKQERRDDELWRLLREKFPGCGRNRKDWPSWVVLAKAARELGFEDYARAWENSAPQ